MLVINLNKIISVIFNFCILKKKNNNKVFLTLPTKKEFERGVNKKQFVFKIWYLTKFIYRQF